IFTSLSVSHMSFSQILTTPQATYFPYTTLFRSAGRACRRGRPCARRARGAPAGAPRWSSGRAACRGGAPHRSPGSRPPAIRSLGFLVVFVALAGSDRAVDEAREPVAPLDRLVVHEAKLRRGVHLQALR